MKALILRTMAHTRVWERENRSCYYDCDQLENMILAWEPHFNEFSINNFNIALGIYTQKYFHTTRYGRMPYNGTPEECSISLLKLRPYGILDGFTNIENGRLNIHYKFVKKLWDGGDQMNRMLTIDNQLIQEKINESEQLPRTRYMWPLSFSISSDTAMDVLCNNDVDLREISVVENIDRLV